MTEGIPQFAALDFDGKLNKCVVQYTLYLVQTCIHSLIRTLISILFPPLNMAHLRRYEDLKISLNAIKSATRNFSAESYIGRGGFGKVYVGEIPYFERRMMVALKRLDRAFGQGDPEFWKEIMLLSAYKHENIVSLLGYCDDANEKILVYEYMPNKSLDQYLNKPDLSWVQRLNIAIGAAKGLAYLHSATGTQQRVLHRDIKSSNILLDMDMNAKVSDFGLSKFGPANQSVTFMVSNPVGTMGYIDPEYVETGLLTKESDCFSFGVVLFEVLSGRLSFRSNNECQPLTILARKCYEGNTLSEILFEGIKEEVDGDSLKTYTEIAYQCLKRDPKDRPLMTDVVKALESALESKQALETALASTLEHQFQVLDLTSLPAVGILNVNIEGARNLKVSQCPPGTSFALRISFRLTGDYNQVSTMTLSFKTANPKWNVKFNLYVKDPNVQALQALVHLGQRSNQNLEMWKTLGTLKDLTPQVPERGTIYLRKNEDDQKEEPNEKIMFMLTYKLLTSDNQWTNTCQVGGSSFSYQITY